MKQSTLVRFLMMLMLLLVLNNACKKCDEQDPASDCYEAPDTSLVNVASVNWDSLAYAPVPYEIDFPPIFENIKDDYYIPADNPLTEQGIQLGRMLFYDPILSLDSTISCGSCHAVEFAFTDSNNALSEGVGGAMGTRNSMPLFNLGWQPSFFWDGSEQSLEEQALLPVENELEMHQPWEGAVAKLMNQHDYRVRFYEAFGDTTITKELVVKAIAQFERTLISGQSKYDLAVTPGSGVTFTPEEELGFTLFVDELGGDCFHCHVDPGFLFTDNQFHNNGLDSVATFEQFTDWGLGAVTGIPQDNGRFRTPSLRNIAQTAPYMHDGRFASLEEVLDFYSEGVQPSPNLDIIMVTDFNSSGKDLSEDEKAAIITFLHTLTDTTYLNNPAYKNPFD